MMDRVKNWLRGLTICGAIKENREAVSNALGEIDGLAAHRAQRAQMQNRRKEDRRREVAYER